MAEQVMDKKDKKFGKAVIISGIILGVVTVLTGICIICKVAGVSVSPEMLVAGTAWCLMVFPLAIVAFIICLMWNTTNTAKAAGIKMFVTIVLLFCYMMYSMFAMVMVWVVKVDNMPSEDTATAGYQIVQEVEELV